MMPTNPILLSKRKLSQMFNQLNNNWDIIDGKLEKDFYFQDFKSALNFTNKIAKIAEKENHHPEIRLSYGKVRVILFTHKFNAISDLDFMLAEKISLLD